MKQFLIEEKLREYKEKVYDPFLMQADRINPTEWTDFKHYLLTEEATDVVDNLMNISVQRLRKIVSHWIYENNKKNKVEEFDGIDFFSLLEFETGFRWVELISKNSFSNEGLMMNNCVSAYYKYGNMGLRTSKIFSLRNENNEPKITMEYDPRWNKVVQIRGRSNNLINLKYTGYLVNILNYLNSKCLFTNLLKEDDSLSKIHKLMGFNDVEDRLSLVDSMENLGIFVKDNRFETILKESEINCKLFNYHKRLGFINKITCNKLIIRFDDLKLLENSVVNAEEIRVLNSKEFNEDCISKKWSYLYIQSSSKNNLRDLFEMQVGRRFQIMDFENYEGVLFQVQREGHYRVDLMQQRVGRGMRNVTQRQAIFIDYHDSFRFPHNRSLFPGLTGTPCRNDNEYVSSRLRTAARNIVKEDTVIITEGVFSQIELMFRESKLLNESNPMKLIAEEKNINPAWIVFDSIASLQNEVPTKNTKEKVIEKKKFNGIKPERKRKF